jgi:hypothetical protein
MLLHGIRRDIAPIALDAQTHEMFESDEITGLVPVSSNFHTCAWNLQGHLYLSYQTFRPKNELTGRGYRVRAGTDGRDCPCKFNFARTATDFAGTSPAEQPQG